MWPDHLLSVTSYLVTIATDHHRTFLKMCARHERTATKDGQVLMFYPLEKTQKNLMGGGDWHTSSYYQ